MKALSVMDNSSLTNKEVHRSMNALYMTIGIWTLFGAAATGSMLSGMMLSIGMTDTQIGYTMALTLIFLPVQLLGTWLQPRFFNRKHFWEVLGTIYYAGYLLIACLVAARSSLPREMLIVFFLILFGIANCSTQLCGAVVLAWQGEVIPRQQSNNFWTRRTAIAMFGAMVSGILLGAAADWLGRDKSSTYAALLMFGSGFGFLTLVFQARVPDYAPRGKAVFHFKELWNGIWAEPNFRRLTTFFSVQTAANWFMGGFVFIYLQRSMNFSQTAIQILLAVSGTVSFLSSYLFKYFGNRFGRRPLLLLCTVLKAVEFFLWAVLLLPGNGWIDQTVLWAFRQAGIPTDAIPAGFFSAVPVMILGGFVNMGLAAGQLSLLTSVGGKENRSFMIAVFYTVMGVTGAIVSGFSGHMYALLDASPLPRLTGLSNFNLACLAGAGIFLFSLVFFRKFQEPGAAPAAHVIRSILAHNPFRTLYHAWVLDGPIDEVRHAKKLLELKGALADGELISGLRSASARIRQSALWNVSVSEEPLSPEMEQALIGLLTERRLGMRQLALRTLARHLCPAALPELIRGFDDPDSDFASLCIHGAGLYNDPAAEAPLAQILADRNRAGVWPAASETLSRSGNWKYGELILNAYKNEPEWTLSRQCLLSLCRTMLGKERMESLPSVFEEEEKQSGASLETHVEAIASLTKTSDPLLDFFRAGDYVKIADCAIRAQLDACKMPSGGEIGAVRMPRGDNRELVFLRISLRLRGMLQYEGREPDPMKFLALLLLSEKILESR